MRKLFASLVLSLLAGSASAATAGFEDAWQFFGRASGSSLMSTDDYDDSLRSLARQFDAICGDVFCEGEFSNLSSLGIDCSVNHASGVVGQCVWTFAGSYTEIDPSTGKLSVTKRTYTCDLGIQGSAAELAAFLRQAGQGGTSGYDGLRDFKAPGSGKDLMTMLTGCL